MKMEEGEKTGEKLAGDVAEKIVQFLWWMKKQGYRESTIISRGSRLRRLAKLGANLLDPESVKEVIAKQDNWSESRKEAMVYAYDLFAKYMEIKWNRPVYKPSRKLPFIPLEREIDDLIAGCNKFIATFLQIGKETAARAGEIYNLKWTDIDFERQTIRITAEKGSEPRIFKISSKLLGMLNGLQRKDEKIFSHYKTLKNLTRTYERYRRRTAYNLGNPRLLRITFHTLRHWKATMTYHQTRDILHTMKILGHKNIKNTLLYTQLIAEENNDEYICKTAKTLDQASQLIENGFEYVCEIDAIKLFRKRK
jgi:integrase